MTDSRQLSRRERQIMDIVYAGGEASVNDVLARLPDPPTRTAVRTLMRILEDKGHLRRRTKGREYFYRPIRSRKREGRSALRGVLRTFFDGSLEQAFAAHFSDSGAEISDDELQRLAALIEQAKKKGRSS